MEHLHRALERLRAESSRNLRVSASDPVITESETSIDDTVNAVERSRTSSVGWSGVGKSKSSPIDRVSGTNLKNTSVAHDKLKESDDPYADLASFSFGKDKTRRVRSERRAIDDGGRRPSLPINRYTLGRPNADDFGGPLSRSNPETSGSDSEPIQKKSTHTMSTSGSGSETPSRTPKYTERTELPPKLPVTDRFSKRKKVATPSNQTQRRPTPIRNLANAPKTTGEMMWNPQTLRWEGNDRAGGTPSIYSDPGNESGVVDTDVELEDIAPEDASLYTLGEPVRSSYAFDFVAKF
ncbi:hypothetical protein BJY52DRAFT_799038 [Lactarius psammicola]|nr:hypothetical protein BJY52DRAFT_799038 [Lactarius psammicola]